MPDDPRAAVDRIAQRFVKQSQTDASAGKRERPVTHQQARDYARRLVIKNERKRGG